MINPNCVAFVSSRDFALAAWNTGKGERVIVYSRTIPAEGYHLVRRGERWIASGRLIDTGMLAPVAPVRLRRTIRQTVRRVLRQVVRLLAPPSDLEYQLRAYQIYRFTHPSPPCGS